MSFYDDPESVKKYIEMCEGYDGSAIYSVLAKELPKESSILEFGSGAGLDIEFLKSDYNITGSDLSNEFLRLCEEKHPEIPLLKLDVKKLDIKEKYNCIYSNKVLHHLTEAELQNSLAQQVELLSPGGIIAHSFWLGEESKVIEGLLFTYYGEAHLLDIISRSYKIVTTLKYTEFEEGDSLFVIAQAAK